MFILKLNFLILAVTICLVCASSTPNQVKSVKSKYFRHHRRLNDEIATKLDVVKNAIPKLQDLLSLIYNRYEMFKPVGADFIHSVSHLPQLSWKIQKYLFAEKILSNADSFLMIFGGSSVTAGHDNQYNQSYPEIIGKRMRPIFSALGIKLTVHNIAQGANNCFPSNLCYEPMGGYNPDIVGWEQSFNCGRSVEFVEMVGRFGAEKGADIHISC